MKQSDINKIDSATARIEKLQCSLVDAPREVKEALSDAKKAMIRALNCSRH